jgi:hypothetical protein
MSLRSVPPVAMPGPAKAKPPRMPSLEERSPRRLALRRASATAITSWARRGGVSITELAEAWGESRAVVHDRLTGEKSLPIEHLLVLPRRQRDQLLALLADVGDSAAA